MSQEWHSNSSEIPIVTRDIEMRHVAERLVDASSFFVSQAACLPVGPDVFSVRLDPNVRVAFRHQLNGRGDDSELYVKVDRGNADPVTWRSFRCGQLRGFEVQVTREGGYEQDIMLMRGGLGEQSTLFINGQYVAYPKSYAPLIRRVGREVLAQEFSAICGLEVVKKLQTEARDWTRRLAYVQRTGKYAINGGYATAEAATHVQASTAYEQGPFVITAQEWRQGVGGSLMRLLLFCSDSHVPNETEHGLAITEFSCISEPMIAAISSVIQEKTA